MHHLIWNIAIDVYLIISWSYANILAYVCKNFWGVYYLWFLKVTLHLNIQDSLPGVVSVTIAVIYLILPLNMYMQMVQNICF